MELADVLQRGINLSRSSAADESELLEEDVLSLHPLIQQEVLCHYF